MSRPHRHCPEAAIFAVVACVILLALALAAFVGCRWPGQ